MAVGISIFIILHIEFPLVGASFRDDDLFVHYDPRKELPMRVICSLIHESSLPADWFLLRYFVNLALDALPVLKSHCTRLKILWIFATKKSLLGLQDLLSQENRIYWYKNKKTIVGAGHTEQANKQASNLSSNVWRRTQYFGEDSKQNFEKYLKKRVIQNEMFPNFTEETLFLLLFVR